MTRRRRWFLVLGTAGAVVAAVVILVLLYVPIAQESSGYTAIGSRLYSFEAVSLFDQSTSWPNITYRGVTFGFHLWCLFTSGAGKICGNATESGGAVYSYTFWDGPPRPSPNWQTWVAPDGHEAVQHRQGGLAHLLVEV